MKVVLLTCFAQFTLILLARNFNQVLQQLINPPSPVHKLTMDNEQFINY